VRLRRRGLCGMTDPMEHEAKLVVTVVGGLVLAFGFGFIANRLRLPLLVGYLLAGIALGPFTPGPVADAEIASQLAEIGIILLMFGVGLHFSLSELMAVRWIAVPGAVGQIAIATAITTAIASGLWGWSIGGGLVLGLALSVASTVVVLRALDERSAVETPNGRIAVGWLIVEDLAMVLTLVLLPPLAALSGSVPPVDAHGAAAVPEGNIAVLLAFTILKILAFVALVIVVGPRVVPWLLGQAARTGSHELFTLSVLAIALGIAFGAAQIFGVSFALGAFCAGVVLSNTPLSQRAAAEALPLQHAFAVLFFVSVGMLFDPTILVREPLAVLAVLFIILIGKSIAAFAIVLIMGYPLSTALTVSASLAQIGEFSFILAALGIALGLMPEQGRDLILAGALLSVTLNPLAFALIGPASRWFKAHPGLTARLEPAQERKLQELEMELEDRKRALAPVAIKPEELAAKFPIFADLDDAKRSELLTLFKPRSARPGTRLIRAGDSAEEMFFIAKGAVEVAVPGQPIKLSAGDFFGEMGLLSGAPRSADVTAIDYCQLLTLGRADFLAFIEKHPELRAKIGTIAISREEDNKRRREQAPPGITG
jgi:monovalent cation:H+ antiporter-2, CPA2 family